MLTHSRARLLVVSEEVYPKFENLVGSIDGLRVIVSGDNPHGHQRLEDLLAGMAAGGSYRGSSVSASERAPCPRGASTASGARHWSNALPPPGG